MIGLVFQPMGPVESWGMLLMIGLIIALITWLCWPQPRPGDSPILVEPTGLVRPYRPVFDWSDGVFDERGRWRYPHRDRRVTAELLEEENLWPTQRSLYLTWKGICITLGSRYCADPYHQSHYTKDQHAAFQEEFLL